MLKTKTKTILAEFALFFTAIIWGCGFVVMKQTMNAIAPSYLVGIRFAVAAIALALILHKKMRGVHKADAVCGVVLGVLLYGSFIAQTYGLMYTTVGKNAFITTVYVVLVPFVSWAIYKKRPDAKTLISALICFSGIGILSLDGSDSVNIGDMLTLVGGVMFAIHISYVDKFTGRGQDVMVLTLVQFATAGALGLIFGLLFEPFPARIDAPTLMSLAYLCILGTLVAMSLQNIGIKHANGSHASLILSSESFLGCIAGIIFLGEKASPRIIVGGILIFFALVLSQVKKRGSELKSHA